MSETKQPRRETGGAPPLESKDIVVFMVRRETKCAECGGEISDKRLRALPFAVRCKECEEGRELAAEREKALAQKRNGPAFFFDMSS